MTSNLGVREDSTRLAGFGKTGEFDPSRQDAAISDALLPELLNRITATIRFDVLSPDALRELARIELERAFSRFERQGWRIDFDEKIVDWVARFGCEARYGARHVQRLIESEVFSLIAASDSRHLELSADQDGVMLTAGSSILQSRRIPT